MLKKEKDIYKIIKDTNDIVLKKEIIESKYFKEVEQTEQDLKIVINEKVFHKSLNLDISYTKSIKNKDFSEELLNNSQYCEDLSITLIKYLLETKNYHLLKEIRIKNCKNDINVEFDFVEITNDICDSVCFKNEGNIITKYINFNFENHTVNSDIKKYLKDNNDSKVRILDLYNNNAEDEDFFIYQLNSFPKGFEYYLYNLILLKLSEYGYLVSNKFKEIQVNTITIKDLNNLLENKPIKNIPKSISRYMDDNSISTPFISFKDIIKIFNMKNYYICDTNKIDSSICNYSLKEIMDLHNVKCCDSYKELVIQKLDNIFKIKELEEYGFSINQINYLINNNRIIGSISNSITLYKYLEFNNIKQTFKKLTSVQDITLSLKQCDKLLRDLLEIEEFNINDLNFYKSLRNLELDIRKVYFDLITNKVGPMYYKVDKIGFENIKQKYDVIDYELPINYENKIEEVIFKTKNLTFALPLYAELVKLVASDLRLCIDTYIHKIRTQRCVLVLVRKEEEYIGCLELDNNFEYLVQAKAYNNTLFDKKDQLEILDFCKNNNIDINTKDMNIIFEKELLNCSNY